MTYASQFTAGGTPLRCTWLTAASGTFTPLSGTTWMHLIMIGAGGAGGSASSGYYTSGGGYGFYGVGGKGGTAAQSIITWYKRESVSGTPIASYSYICGSASGFSSTWNTGSAGTLGQIIAVGGGAGGSGTGNYGGYNNQYGSATNQMIATTGESSILGRGGSPGGTGQGYGSGGGGGSHGGYGYDEYSSNGGGGGGLGLIIVTEY